LTSRQAGLSLEAAQPKRYEDARIDAILRFPDVASPVVERGQAFFEKSLIGLPVNKFSSS
jgi:hypothetical protein